MDLVEVPEGVDVLVLPGIVDTGIDQLDDGRWAYPGTAADLVKLLREEGLNVDWAHVKSERAPVEHNAADVWLPILLFVREALASGAGEVMATAIMSLLGRNQAEISTLHVKFLEKSKSGKTRRFEASGPGADVLKAMERFDRES